MGMFSQLAQGVDWSSMGQMILRIAAVLLCLVIHEVSHGLAAYHLGDPTAKQSHRLSLNPLRHLDPFGLIMMIAVGFGWAKPVPVDPRYFKKPKQGMAITALAGPASNFVLAYVSTIIYSMLFAVAQVKGETTGLGLALTFFSLLISLNIGLGIFNLIPFPPLDGSKILGSLLPPQTAARYLRIEYYTRFVFLGIVLVSWLSPTLSDILFWPLEFLRSGILNLYQALMLLLF